jgi:hypothetical protein
VRLDLWCDQHNVQILARCDQAEMHVQAVCEQQASARFHVGRQHLGVELLLHHVRRQHGDQIGILDRFGRRLDGETIGLGLGLGWAARTQADDHITTGVAQV